MSVTNDFLSGVNSYVHLDYNCHINDLMLAKRQTGMRSYFQYIPSKCPNASIGVCLTYEAVLIPWPASQPFY